MINIKEISSGETDVKLKLLVKPISVISNVDGINSAIKLSTDRLSNNKIFGIIENISDFHFPNSIRNEIKKKNKTEKNMTKNHHQSTGYFPIVDDFVKIDDVDYSNIKVEYKFFDLTSSLLKAGDNRHLKGIKTVSKDLVNYFADKVTLTDNEMNDLMKTNPEFVPFFYTSVKKVQYMVLNGYYEIFISTTDKFAKFLLNKNKNNRLGYVGNSESLAEVEVLYV